MLTHNRFDLANCTTLGGLPLIESYDGEKFDVRHTLLITINRPWYTFNVNKVIPIAVQHLAGAPAKDEDAKVVANQLGSLQHALIDDGEFASLTMPFSFQQTNRRCFTNSHTAGGRLRGEGERGGVHTRVRAVRFFFARERWRGEREKKN